MFSVSTILVGVAVLVIITVVVVLIIVFGHFDNFPNFQRSPQRVVPRIVELDPLEAHLKASGLVNPQVQGTSNQHAYLPAWVQAQAPTVHMHPAEQYWPICMEDYISRCELRVDTGAAYQLHRPRNAHQKGLQAWLKNAPSSVHELLQGTPVEILGQTWTRRCRNDRLQLIFSQARIPVDVPTDVLTGYRSQKTRGMRTLYPHLPRMYARVRHVNVQDVRYVDVFYEWFYAFHGSTTVLPGQGTALLDRNLVVHRYRWPHLGVPVARFLSQHNYGTWYTTVHNRDVYVARNSHALYPTSVGRLHRAYGLADDLVSGTGDTWVPLTTFVPAAGSGTDPVTWAPSCDGTCADITLLEPPDAIELDLPAWWWFPGGWASALLPSATAQPLAVSLERILMPGYTVVHGAQYGTLRDPGTPVADVTQVQLRQAPREVLGCETVGLGWAGPSTAEWSDRAEQVATADNLVDWTMGVGAYLLRRVVDTPAQNWWQDYWRIGGFPLPARLGTVLLQPHNLALTVMVGPVTFPHWAPDTIHTPAPHTLSVEARGNLQATAEVTFLLAGMPAVRYEVTLTLPDSVWTTTADFMLPLAFTDSEWYIPYVWRGAGPPSLGKVSNYRVQVRQITLEGPGTLTLIATPLDGVGTATANQVVALWQKQLSALWTARSTVIKALQEALNRHINQVLHTNVY